MPDSERPIKIPGPKLFISIFFSVPVIVGVLAYLLNGTDYFMGGLIGICTGPVAYFIFKRKYGGLHKTDPDNHPVNPATGLARGDMYRISYFFLVVCVLAILGSVFLPWYEGSWGPEYYLDTYGADVFGTFLAVIRGFAAGGAVLFVIFRIIAGKTEKRKEGN